MAAARHIPRNEPETAWTISFTYNGSTMIASYPALKGVQFGDQVTFANSASSTAPINITFNSNPPVVTNPPGPVLFNNTPNLQPGIGDEQQPQAPNGSVNYYVNVVGGPSFGPYAIQVGAGPMYIEITSLNSEPDPILIPKGGTLQMYSNDNNTYDIGWPSFNPFPGLTQANPGAANNNPYTQSGPAQNYAYSVSVNGQDGPGGGTIKVG
jgi:hypothetical protein